MPVNQQAILEQIDHVLQYTQSKFANSQYSDLSGLPDELISELNTSLYSIIDRFAPAGSKHRESATAAVSRYNVDNSYIIKVLVGILKSLRTEYASGNLRSIQELIHGDVFSDFLEMADHLLSEGYKDPSAVLTGGVLEEHLRKLCQKNNLPVLKSDGSPLKADAINSALASANVISKLDQKNITAWLGLRNNAAHGNYSAYSKEQVALYIAQIRDFITRSPA